MEQVAVTAVNTFAPLSNSASPTLCILFVDGRPFFPVGTSPDFIVLGSSITWNNATFSVTTGSRVIAFYSIAASSGGGGGGRILTADGSGSITTADGSGDILTGGG
jgi:hypothetical protein